MAIRQQKPQSSLFDEFLRNSPENTTLDRINQIVDWAHIRNLIAPTYGEAQAGGGFSYDPVILAKMLLLESLYNLSDVRCARECADRLSFRRFLGLSLECSVPDDTTIVRFRERLRKNKLHEVIEKEILAMIRRKGLSIKPGAIIDATVIPAATRPAKSKEDKSVPVEETRVSPTTGTGEEENPDQEAAKQDSVSEPSARSYVDSDANFVKKGGRTYFGYKLHLARVFLIGLIQNWVVTRASVNDINVFGELLEGDEPRVLADRGYPCEKNHKALAAIGAKDLIMKKVTKKTRLLQPIIQEWNGLVSRYRSEIENTFANLKRWRGLGRARYLGLEKMQGQVAWSVAAHNLLIGSKKLFDE